MSWVKDIAKKIIVELKLAGCNIQLYESMTTNSIYIKVDYGVCNSIRISDHNGKKHLNYKYNVLSTCNAYNTRKSREGWDRRFYPVHQWNRVVSHVLSDRKVKIKKYGQDRYNTFMRANQVSNENSRGFWSQCVKV